MDPHCRIGRVKIKRRSRYRSPDAFNLKINELRAALKRKRLLGSVHA
jgi:hypothetical protein